MEALKTRLWAARDLVKRLEKKIEEERKKCQHVFLTEYDGDSKYYICVHCEYTTRIK